MKHIGEEYFLLLDKRSPNPESGGQVDLDTGVINVDESKIPYSR